MPSGAKKRKAAKKKQVHNPSSTSPHQENDSQDPLVEVVKREASSSEDKAKDVNDEEGNIEIETGSKSKSSSSTSSDSSDDESQVVDKNVVVLESAPVESVPFIESQVPEEISPIVEPVKPVDLLLDEVSQVFDDIKNEEKKALVVEEAPVVLEEPTVVVSNFGLKDDCPTASVVVESAAKENEVEKLPLSLEPEEYVASSTPPKDSISEVHGADCANETDTVEHSDRQATVASTPLAVQKTTSWKSCCGIFELFSGSQRN